VAGINLASRERAAARRRKRREILFNTSRNQLKSHVCEARIQAPGNLDFVAPGFDFVAPGLDFVVPDFDFVVSGLEFVAAGLAWARGANKG
jgi:hypothetical protein